MPFLNETNVTHNDSDRISWLNPSKISGNGASVRFPQRNSPGAIDSHNQPERKGETTQTLHQTSCLRSQLTFRCRDQANSPHSHSRRRMEDWQVSFYPFSCENSPRNLFPFPVRHRGRRLYGTHDRSTAAMAKEASMQLKASFTWRIEVQSPY